MSNKVTIKESTTGQVLSEFKLSEQDIAYKKAAEYEEMGISVTIDSPSAPETLLESLGANKDTLRELKKIIDHEIESHNTCCPSENSSDHSQANTRIQ